MLIIALMAALIGSISLLALLKGIQSSYHFQRTVASNIDVSETATLIRLILGSEETCANSGLIDLNTATLFEKPSHPVPVNLALDRWVGRAGAINIGAGFLVGQSRKISSFNLISLTRMTDDDRVYLGKLELKTTLLGRALTPSSKTQIFSLLLSIDPKTRRVLQCGGAESTLPTAESSVKLVWGSVSLNRAQPCGGIDAGQIQGATPQFWGTVLKCPDGYSMVNAGGCTKMPVKYTRGNGTLQSFEPMPKDPESFAINCCAYTLPSTTDGTDTADAGNFYKKVVFGVCVK